MILVPPSVLAGASIPPGTVYYFREESLSSDDPHYFIVLNHDPDNDSVLLLVCPTSQVEKAVWRCHRRGQSSETLVLIKKEEYRELACDSAVDCNFVFEKTKSQINAKISKGEVEMKALIEHSTLHRLREAVLKSPSIEKWKKALLSK